MKQARIIRPFGNFVVWFSWLCGAGLICVVIFTLFFTSAAHAAQTVPYKINFQGRLTDSSGNVVTNGSYNIKLRLMSASSGGSNLWETTRSGSNKVTVTNGLFNVQLGDTVAGDPALSPTIFNTQTNATVYLEVELPTPLSATGSSPDWSEGAMTPRQLMAAAPYAMNADTVDGIDGASLAQLGANQSFTGNNTFTGTSLFKPASDSTTAFQIQKSDATPLLVADTSNLALKVGGGDVSPDASPALLVLDYKNTSGDPSGTNGGMYYNSSSNRFRCYEAGAWADCITKDTPLQNKFRYQNDFTNYVSYTTTGVINRIDTTLDTFSNQSGSSVVSVASETSHPGIWRMATGTVSSGNAFITSSLDGSGLYYGQYFFGGNNGAFSYAAGVRIPTASVTASNGFNVYIGFNNNVTTHNGCFFRYSDNINSGKWQGYCATAGTSTNCDTTITMTTTRWYHLQITVNAAATLATFTVTDGTSGTSASCTVASNIPTTATSISNGIIKTSGTTSRTMDFDYLEFSYSGMTR